MEHFSLFELNKIIGEVLSRNLEPSYWVIAEIGEIRQHQNGHCYLELVEKDDNQIKAKSRATIWAYTYRNLSGWFEAITGQSLKPGMKILCNATVQFHEVYGFSLNIKDIDAQYTLGERAKKRQEIITQLMEDGVYDLNKELPLPVISQNIAVISSASAAGYGDFVDQLNNNGFGYHFNTELFNSTMQGDKAEASIIASMLTIFDRIGDFDLLVIIRGGGASVDLDCFDSYEMASHIAQFPIPVITGIGHERDETIADLVAHTKMKTPTAVAEFIISGAQFFESLLDDQFTKITNKLEVAIEEERVALDQRSNRFQRGTQLLLNEQRLTLNSISHQLLYSKQNRIKFHEQQLDGFRQQLAKNPFKNIDHEYAALIHMQRELDIIDPKNVLKRGYSLTLVNGKNINKVKDLKKDTKITTITRHLELESSIVSTKKINHDN